MDKSCHEASRSHCTDRKWNPSADIITKARLALFWTTNSISASSSLALFEGGRIFSPSPPPDLPCLAPIVLSCLVLSYT